MRRLKWTELFKIPGIMEVKYWVKEIIETPVLQKSKENQPWPPLTRLEAIISPCFSYCSLLVFYFPGIFE